MNILTLNCANYEDHPAWETRLPLIVDAIKHAQADIIALTEIRYTPSLFFNTICQQYWAQPQFAGVNLPGPCGTLDMGAQILALLQTQPGYAGAQIFTSQVAQYAGGVWEGQSIIWRSTLNVTATGYQPFATVGSDGNARGIQWVGFQLNAGPLTVYNTHFALDEADRVEDAQETVALLQNNLGNPIGGLGCVLGDLNATPDDQALQLLSNAGLIDAWNMLYPGQDGYTFPSWGPVKRIDYCWASSAMPISGVQLVPTVPGGAVTAASGGVVFASDHIGVVTTFNVS